MRWTASRITVGAIILLLLSGILAAGCAADLPDAPGAAATALPAATDLPTITPLPIATDLPAATDLPTPTALPAADPTPAVGLLQLVAALDDPLHYCVDVTGHSGGVRLDAPLQAHTCKPGADDQVFAVRGGSEHDELRMPAYAADGGHCLAVTDAADSPAILAPCRSQDETLFSVAQLRNDGRLSVKAESLRGQCIGVAAGVGEPAGGRNHLRRDLVLYDCAAADPALVSWELVGR